MQIVKHVLLLIDRRLRRVEILRHLPIAERAPRESDDLSPLIVNRKRQPVAKPVIPTRALGSLANEARCLHGLFTQTLSLERGDQEPTSRRCIAEPEQLLHLRSQPSPLNILPGASPTRILELLAKPTLSFLVHQAQRITKATFDIAHRIPRGGRHRNAMTLGNRLQRLVKGEALRFHQEVEDIAALATAKTLEDL